MGLSLGLTAGAPGSLSVMSSIGAKRALLGLLAAIGATAAIGCGSEDLTADEFTEEADAICLTARGEFNDLQKEPPRSADEAEELVSRLLEIARAEVEGISDLDAPEELQSHVDDYLAAREEAIQIMEQGLEAAQDNDESGYTRAQREVAEQQKRRLRLAKEAGMSECSRGLSSVG